MAECENVFHSKITVTKKEADCLEQSTVLQSESLIFAGSGPTAIIIDVNIVLHIKNFADRDKSVKILLCETF